MATGLWYFGAKSCITIKWWLQPLGNQHLLDCSWFLRSELSVMNESSKQFSNFFITILYKLLSVINHKFFLSFFSKFLLLYYIILFMRNKKIIRHKWIVVLKNDSKVFFKQIKININWIRSNKSNKIKPNKN